MNAPIVNESTSVSNATLVSAVPNTDFSVDGSSILVKFKDGSNGQFVDINFDGLDLTTWEDFLLNIYTSPRLNDSRLFRVTIDGADFDFGAVSDRGLFKAVLFDVDLSTSTITSVRITCLVDDELRMFVDTPMARKTTAEDQDLDLVNALQAAISLDYGVVTTITAPVPVAATTIPLASRAYINDRAEAEIEEEGGGTKETIVIINRMGKIEKPLVNGYASGATVTILVPVRLDRKSPEVFDPQVGIVILGHENDPKIDRIEKISGKVFRTERWTGELSVSIYVQASSERRFNSLVRQFQNDHGDAFTILLDGETVDVWGNTASVTSQPDFGDASRTVFFYSIKPRPVTIATQRVKVVPTVIIRSKHAETTIA